MGAPRGDISIGKEKQQTVPRTEPWSSTPQIVTLLTNNTPPYTVLPLPWKIRTQVGNKEGNSIALMMEAICTSETSV
jgi:hypothetical protein